MGLGMKIVVYSEWTIQDIPEAIAPCNEGFDKALVMMDVVDTVSQVVQ